jgi:DHA1 family bicyclomycin/chloramphenicol resistance-like MFS transporter
MTEPAPTPRPGRELPPVSPPPLLILVISTAIGSLGMHMVVPALPEMAHVFGIPLADIGYVVTAYLIGLSSAQLLIGPLSDRFGRRPVLLGGIFLFLAMTVLCILAPSATWLFIGRGLQAFGGCTGIVLGRAIIRDCYARDRAASSMGYLTVALATGSMLAPAVGAFVIAFTDWRGVFYLLTGVGALAAVTTLWRLPETNRMPLDRLDLNVVMRNYRWLLRQRSFVLHGLPISLQLSGWFSFVTVMPGVLVTVYGLPAASYGLWVFVTMTGYVVGNFTVGQLSMRIGGRRLMQIGSLISAIGIVAMVIAGPLGAVSGPLAYFGTMAIVVLGNGIISPNANVAAISVNPAFTGAASGLLGFMQWTISAIATGIVNGAGTSGLVALTAVVVVGNISAILCLTFARRSPAP